MSVLIHGAKQIARISCVGEKFKIKQNMSDIALLEASDSEGLSIAIDEHGKIQSVGFDSEVRQEFDGHSWSRTIDASGMSIIPGLVDAHTHPVWAGDRVHEFAMKLAGASYMDVHKAGGGIHFTVERTQKASKEDLLDAFVNRANQMSKSGTTLVECKSGYGLDFDTELKMLQVLDEARPKVNLGISSTYCGAHAVPKNKTSQEATKEVVEDLSKIKSLVDSGKLNVESVDVFCEKGVFSVDETKKILEEARKFGFLLNFHAEELNYIGGVEMGASLKAEAMSHLEEISLDGITAMSNAGSVAVLLPTTAFLLRLKQPPARTLIENGVPVALGSDFNPNAHCFSMPIVMFLACVQMKMSMNEALVSATLNAAHSLRRSQEVGSIEKGKWADLVLIKAPKWEHLIYQMGNHEELISKVIYHGNVVASK